MFLSLAACAQNRPNEPLLGTTWKLTSYGLANSPKPAFPESEGMIIFGADGKVKGIGACNQFEGDYEVKGEQITVGTINWGSENCPNPDMRQELQMSILLKDIAGFKINGNTLTLTKKMPNGHDVVITFEAVANSKGN